MSDLDVIIPAYGGTDLTWRCLTHLWLFGVPNMRIVVVDDCSPDNTPKMGEWLMKSGTALYHRHEKNMGCTVGWNTGLKLTEENRAPYVLFINNDIAVMPGALSMLLAAARAGNKIVGANQSVSEKAARFDPAEFLTTEEVATLKIKSGVQTSCFMVERAFLDSLGGFDGNMQHGFADTDFVLRANEVRVASVVVTNARVFHGGSVALKRQGVERGYELWLRDRDVFRKKWEHRPEILEGTTPPTTKEEQLKIIDYYWSMGEQP